MKKYIVTIYMYGSYLREYTIEAINKAQALSLAYTTLTGSKLKQSTYSNIGSRKNACYTFPEQALEIKIEPYTGKSKVKRLLKERGITQKVLASEINKRFPDLPIALDTLSRFVSGDRPDVRMLTIFRICAVLKVTPNEIIDYN